MSMKNLTLYGPQVRARKQLVKKARRAGLRLDDVIVRFSDGSVLTVRDLLENVLILGANGSGKTSGSGRAVALGLLRAEFGGLWLTNKGSEVSLVKELAAKADRSRDLVIVGPGAHHSNILENLANGSGTQAGVTEHIVHVLRDAMALVDGRQGEGGAVDPFWDRARDELLRNAIDLIRLAGETLSFARLTAVVRTAPSSPGDVDALRRLSDRMMRGERPCRELTAFEAIWVGAARRHVAGERTLDQHSFRETIAFWTESWPRMPEKTRGSIEATFQAMASPFLRGVLAECFTTDTTITPDASRAGKIIVLNLPVKEYFEEGAIAQALFKTIWQRAMERQEFGPGVRPVFLWADEAHEFFTPDDKRFASTCRSAGACAVFITQNRASLESRLGSVGTENLTGLLQTKIFHANDTETNEWAANLIGRDRSYQASFGTDGSTSFSETTDFLVQPVEFSRLARGGPAFGGVAEGIVFKPGKRWGPKGEDFLRVRFRQDKKG